MSHKKDRDEIDHEIVSDEIVHQKVSDELGEKVDLLTEVATEVSNNTHLTINKTTTQPSKTSSLESDKSTLNNSPLISRLVKLHSELLESTILNETLSLIKQYGFTRIRCLALGSPSESKNAMYQLAYLKEVVDVLAIDDVSLYDPVFNPVDKELFRTMNYAVEELYTPTDQLKTLYFLPHAPLELTEVLLNQDNPLFLLANDLVSHTDRLTKMKLHQTYKTISLLVHLQHDVAVVSDFIPVSKKKRNKKIVYQQPEIVYDLLESYFEKIKISRFQVDGWDNSFSDLAFHVITRKSDDELKKE